MGGSDPPAGEDHGHAPVTGDWPHGYGEASWWPIVVVLGVAGLYAGVGLITISSIVDPRLGVIVVLGGLSLFLGGLAGWSVQAFGTRYWRRGPANTESRYRWGTVLFLCSEVATFGAGLAYYGYVRVGPWPPGHLPDVLSTLVLVNTAVLVASSVTLHLAHGSLRAGRRSRFVGLLATTVLLGVIFLAGQVLEYYEFVVREGFTPTGGVYASAFFGLTGLHGLHVCLGVVLLAVILVRAVAGQFDADRHVSVTTASLYWHFVDGVWLVLVGVLYVGALVPV